MKTLKTRRTAAMLLAVVLMVATACGGGKGEQSASQGGSPAPGDDLANRTYATMAQVLDSVKAAINVTEVPADLQPPLGESAQKVPGPRPYFDLQHFDDGGTKAIPFGDWAYGDPNGSKLMVVYGDSRANMWTLSLLGVAAKNGWKIRVFGLSGCPGPDLHFLSFQTKAPNTTCDKFREKAIAAIESLRPNLIVAASVSNQLLADGSYPTRDQWADGWKSTFKKLGQSGAKLAMFSDIPMWKDNFDRCLAAHTSDVQACSASLADAQPPYVDAEQAAAEASGALFVPAVQWVCAERCEPIIANKLVYHDQFHFTNQYAQYLTGAVGDALKPVLS